MEEVQHRLDSLPVLGRYKTGEDEYQSLPEFNDLPFDQYVHAKSADPSM